MLKESMISNLDQIYKLIMQEISRREKYKINYLEKIQVVKDIENEENTRI
jgi:hypothetical protein